METVTNANVKTLSMVKLGSNYYALRDTSAVHKGDLENSNQPVTAEKLAESYLLACYEKLSDAVADINAQTLGQRETAEEDRKKIAVYTDYAGKTAVVLLSDVEETTVVNVEKDIILKLNGKRLLLTASGSKLSFGAGVTEAVIDGRVSGSQICKEIAVESSVTEMVVESYAANCKLLGGTYTISLYKSTKASGVLAPRGQSFYVEGCDISALQSSGSGNMYGTMILGPMVLKKCRINCENVNSVAYAVRSNNVENATVEIEDCTLRAYSHTNRAVSFYSNGEESGVHNSVLMAESEAVSRVSGDQYATAICQRGGEMTVTNCKLQAKAANCLARCFDNGENCVAGMTDPLCFADSTSGESGTKYAVGILNKGNLTLENCSVYGTHTGMQLYPNSQTSVTGGIFEGVCHGGIYFSNQNGGALVQDAKISNARYRGSFKTSFAYGDSQYYAAGLYVGNADDETVSNTAVYLDNCEISGSTGNAIVLRGTGGEQNNAIYMSNCTVTGGTIRMDNETHKVYAGKGCDIQAAVERPVCLVETDAVYVSIPA